MRTYLLRIALALLTFLSGLATMRLYTVVNQRVVPKVTAPQDIKVIPSNPALRGRVWPEPRTIDLEFVNTETLAYEGYLVKRFYKTARIEGVPEEPGRMNPVDIQVSFARLARNGKVLATFDDVFYHPLGNATNFGLASLLGTDTKQLVVSQTIWRGGQYWIVSLTPAALTVYCSGDWGVGRGESIQALDIDNDGVDEIVDESTAFYDLQDKVHTTRVPLPEVIFKYDARAKKYLPANTLHKDYSLRDIDKAMLDVNPTANDQLTNILNVTLPLIYAGKKDEGWAFYDKSYRASDKEEIRMRVETDLRADPVYQFLYKNRKAWQSAEVSLPASLKFDLDRKFPGWRYLTVDDEISSFLRENVSPYARPNLISGDFDGNGDRDYAALIEHKNSSGKTGSPDESPVSLVIFLRTVTGFKMHVLDPEGDYLVSMKRGAWDYDFEAQRYFTYPHDAIFTGIFEKAGSSYIYENGRFRSIVTSD
ncbi:MAG: hypothetical protein JWM21_790 [Acidobacteria bacterium]|nr:hypothetical protein [Acidobacteriota bacterium]